MSVFVILEASLEIRFWFERRFTIMLFSDNPLRN